MSRRSSTASESPRAAGRRRATPDKGGQRLHLDVFSGISGNMFLGALLDAGLSRRDLVAQLAGLGLDHSLRVSRVKRGALGGCYVDVRVPRASGGSRKRPNRRLAGIRRMIQRAGLDPDARDRALAIFEALGRAEARVHRVPIDDVHFHEVGAVDSIVDITAAAVAVSLLGIERVTASPVALGHGRVETEHGQLPLPAPATLELLRGIPTVPAHVEWETVTPTGAAILRTLVDEFRPMPAMRVEAIGYGAGGERPGPMPNLLRAVLGRTGGAGSDRVILLETNLDDLVPEHFDHLMERLFEAGALDVSLQHQQMKKNRPGFLVRVLGRPADRMGLAEVLFAESTAIGVRVTESDRIVLEREERRVTTPFGRVGVKWIHGMDGHSTVTAEYDDCRRAARKAGVPLRDVVRAAEEAGRAAFGVASIRSRGKRS